MFADRTNRRQRYSRNITKAGRNVRRVINAPLVERIELAQLDHTHCPLNIGHAKIVTAIIEILVPKAFAHREARLIQRTVLGASAIDSSAVRTVKRHALENGRIIGDDHSPFPESGDVLLLVKAEAAGRSHAASFASFILAPDRMAGILDDGDALLAGNVQDGVHIAALAIQMNWENGFGIRSDPGFELGGVEVASNGIDVHEIHV